MLARASHRSVPAPFFSRLIRKYRPWRGVRKYFLRSSSILLMTKFLMYFSVISIYNEIIAILFVMRRNIKHRSAISAATCQDHPDVIIQNLRLGPRDNGVPVTSPFYAMSRRSLSCSPTRTGRRLGGGTIVLKYNRAKTSTPNLWGFPNFLLQYKAITHKQCCFTSSGSGYYYD